MNQSRSDKFVKVSVIGGSGYTGAELLRVLLKHPFVQIQSITSRKERHRLVSDVYPNLRGSLDLVFSSPDEFSFCESDLVFMATPNGVAMKYARKCMEKGIRIIDLSADFRFKNKEIFEHFYKIEHQCPELLSFAEYGLVELNRSVLKKACIIGNPGCYPTTVLLGLAPLIMKDDPLVSIDSLIADCKSGVSGAGKKLDSSFLFCEVSDNIKAYGLPEHRHHPEILSQLNSMSSSMKKGNFGLTFVPHLVPMIRGMFSTIYAKVLPKFRSINFQNLFEEFYKNELFVDVMPQNSFPETRSVKSSNKLRIALYRNLASDSLIVLVVQDNLMKGAVGQAIQNMNLIFDFPESTGLNFISNLP